MRNIGTWSRWSARPSSAPFEKVKVGDSPTYIIKEKLGQGGFGSVYVGESIDYRNEKVAVKFVRWRTKDADIKNQDEWKAYDALRGTDGVPHVRYAGDQGDYHILIMDKLGSSLSDLQKNDPDKITEVRLKHFAAQAISVLKNVHSKGYVHGDIKPNNLLLGPPGTSEEKLSKEKLFLVDFGLATRWNETEESSPSSRGHVPYDQKPTTFRGTTEYASVHMHLGRRRSRRDDLESLAYTLISLLCGSLPWRGCEGEDICSRVCKRKMSTSLESLCCSLAQPFREFVEHVVELKFDGRPDYEDYISLFKGTGGPSRSTNTAGAQQYARTGKPDIQWISIYDHRQPRKQRYHNDVTDKSLAHFIEKGKEENLLISSVGSCNGLWSLILDAGTHFEEQVYDPSCNLLDRKWIVEQWGRKYYITAIAGSNDGSYFVVMSRGAPYTLQTYLISPSFPHQKIDEHWKKGYRITSLATAGSEWAVVMSHGAGFCFSEQVLELDFVYPKEGIDLRWKSGFLITAAAATMDQVAFVFSKREPYPLGLVHTGQRKENGEPNRSQRTHLSSKFPNEEIRENREEDFYISSLCYGRTVR